MIHQILNLPSTHHSESLPFEDEILFPHFHQHQPTDLFSPIFQHPLETPDKDTTSQTNIKNNHQPKTLKQKKKRIRKYTSNNPNNQKGHWTHQQNLKYHIFLELHALEFIDDQKRKTDKVFKSMAGFIETREPHQCRSHHQKVEKKWGRFPNILLSLRAQNFKKMEAGPVIRQVEKMGLSQENILTENELMKQEQLYKKILNLEVYQKGFCQDPRTQQSLDSTPQDKQSRCHKQNCMCLMMSETYEDQLEIGLSGEM